MSPLEIDFERYQRRIAELEAELDDATESLEDYRRMKISWEARAEVAEAEVERLRRLLTRTFAQITDGSREDMTLAKDLKDYFGGLRSLMKEVSTLGGGGRESGVDEKTRLSLTGHDRDSRKASADYNAAANHAAPTRVASPPLCANEGCGRPRLIAPGVKLCSVCRIAYLQGYSEGFQTHAKRLAAHAARKERDE